MTQEVQRYTGQESWDQLVSDSDQALGYGLARDEMLDALTGVPFVITRVSFRPGITRKVDGKDKQFAYVSCECRVAPLQHLRLAKVNANRSAAKLEPLSSLAELPFDPDEHVVFNDGSTGIYRQIVSYLEQRGIIRLVKEGAEVIYNGQIGETSLDLPPGDWSDILHGEMHFNEDGFGEYDTPIRLYCPRGIRLSKYTNQYNPDGSQTRYLA